MSDRIRPVFHASAIALTLYALSILIQPGLRLLLAAPGSTQYPEAVLARTNGKQPFTPSNTAARFDFPLKRLFKPGRGGPQGAVVKLNVEPLGEKNLLLDTAARGLLLKQSGKGDEELIGVPEWLVEGLGIQTGLFRILRAVSSNGFSLSPAVAEIFPGRDFPWIDGILSSEILNPWLVRLDFRRNRMTLLPYGVDPAGDGMDWPCRRDQNWWIVDVQIDKKPARMLLDSGAPETYLADQWIETNFPERNQRRRRTMAWELVIAGRSSLQKSLIGIATDKSLASPLRKLDGILGFDVLHSFTLTLDYRSGRITLTR